VEAVRGSGGGGEVVTDAELLDAMEALARIHGVSASPEAAAPYAALAKLFGGRQIRAGESVLLYNTGTGLPFSVRELRRSLSINSG